MPKTTLAVAVSLLLVPCGALAQGPQIDRHRMFHARPVVLRVVSDDVTPPRSRWELNLSEGTLPTAALRKQGQPNGSTRSWAYRHPVAIGFLIGAGAGAALGAAQCGPDSYCDYGRAAGATQGAIALGLPGALAGWVVSLVRP